MRTILLPGVLAPMLAIGAGAAPCNAQATAPTCPYGYYLASDGLCYPGAPPAYPPPVYEVAPPIYQPPVVIDGFGLGVGLGFGGRGGFHGGGERGGGGHGHR